jgi:hypothetical protein
MSDNLVLNSSRGAIQFLASLQPLVESDKIELKIQALKMLQTAIAYGSGSSHMVTEWLEEFSQFDEMDNAGQNGFLRHFRPFFHSLTIQETALDNETARCIAFFLRENLIEFEFDAAMLENFGKFAIAYMSTLYPYPVKHEDHDIMEQMLMSVCPDEIRLSFKGLLEAKCPFMKTPDGVVSKTDDQLKNGMTVRTPKRIRRPKK